MCSEKIVSKKNLYKLDNTWICLYEPDTTVLEVETYRLSCNEKNLAQQSILKIILTVLRDMKD